MLDAAAPLKAIHCTVNSRQLIFERATSLLTHPSCRALAAICDCQFLQMTCGPEAVGFSYAVVRLLIGQFAFINFFATGRLHKQLSVIARR